MPKSQHGLTNAPRRFALRVLTAVGAISCAVVWAAAPAGAAQQSFIYSGAEQTFTVPAGVFSVRVLAVGGTGATAGAAGGLGAQVSADVGVTPGETLYVEVGGNGHEATGGFNGGANGGGGGGGASDVRTVPRSLGLSPDHRLLVAGGGGGGGENGASTPGAGGAAGSEGEAESLGEVHGGAAGTLSAPGAGGIGTCANGLEGAIGAGGAGGSGGGPVGGGGGGGVYGGGGGGGGCSDAGGGGAGGSSLVPAGGTAAIAAPGTQPQVQISYAPPQGFLYSGGEQTFTVPAGVSSVHVLAIGGGGGAAGAVGGAAAQVSGNIAVIPGQTLYVEVGGNGQDHGAGGSGGFDGGGAGAAGGGGASDVRTVPRSLGLSPDHRLLVAGGGGGGGENGASTPGAGGAAGSEGEAESLGEVHGGAAGTLSAPGAGGIGTCANGLEGAIGAGGAGGSGGGPVGGGGGGGVYGGGGGGGGCSDAGGGGAGGSSLVPAGGSLAIVGVGTAPQVQITYNPPPPVPVQPAPITAQTGSKPVVSAAKESARTWRAGSALAKLSAKTRRPPVGTTFSFSLNTQATVTLSFNRVLTGRKVGRRCLAQTRANAKHKSCKRTVAAGKLSLAAHSGGNRVTFQGRISAAKKLKPGRYAVTLLASNAAGASAPQTLEFTIVK